jgi:hypothetical protein
VGSREFEEGLRKAALGLLLMAAVCVVTSLGVIREMMMVVMMMSMSLLEIDRYRVGIKAAYVASLLWASPKHDNNFSTWRSCCLSEMERYRVGIKGAWVASLLWASANIR